MHGNNITGFPLRWFMTVLPFLFKVVVLNVFTLFIESLMAKDLIAIICLKASLEGIIQYRIPKYSVYFLF